MPDHLGEDMRKVRVEEKKEEEIKCKHFTVDKIYSVWLRITRGTR